MTSVALFLPDLRGGGAERVMVDLAGAFQRRGLDVDLVVGRERGPYAADVPETVRVVDLEADRVIRALPALVAYLRHREPEALLATLAHANVAATVARLLSRTDTRVVLRETNPPLSKIREATRVRERILPFFMRRFYPRADAWIANSSATASDLATLTGVPRAQIEVLPNPVDVDRIRKLAQEPPPVTWPRDGPPVILAVGRLHPAKGFDMLIDAFARLRQKRQVRLLVLGEGELREELQERVRRSGCGSEIELPGFVSNPYAVMARADVLASSSRYEGFGNVLVEAMAVGTPVVSTRCPGGPEEILDGGRYGPLVPVGDSEAMAAALERTLDCPPSRDLLRRRADEFRLETVADSYLQVLGVDGGPP